MVGFTSQSQMDINVSFQLLYLGVEAGTTGKKNELVNFLLMKGEILEKFQQKHLTKEIMSHVLLFQRQRKVVHL